MHISSNVRYHFQIDMFVCDSNSEDRHCFVVSNDVLLPLWILVADRRVRFRYFLTSCCEKYIAFRIISFDVSCKLLCESVVAWNQRALIQLTVLSFFTCRLIYKYLRTIENMCLDLLKMHWWSTVKALIFARL